MPGKEGRKKKNNDHNRKRGFQEVKKEEAMARRIGRAISCVSLVFAGALLFLGVFLVSSLSATERLSLEDAVVEALANNQDIQVARGEREISSNNVNIGNAGLLPKIDLVGSMNYQDNEKTSSPGFNEFTTTSVTLQANYTLFDGLGNIYTFRKLKSAGKIGRFQARNTIESVILEVSEAFYKFANATEQVVVAEEALAISRDRLERARLRAEYGQANTLEVLSASVDVNADSVSWKDAMLDMHNANRALNLLLNRPVDTSLSVKKDVSFDKNLRREEVLQGAKQSFSAYLIARESVKQAEYELGIKRADFFPEVGVQVGYGFSNTETGFDAGTDDLSGDFSAALTLDFNLFNGFQSSINSQNARIELQNKKLLEQKALSELEKQVADTWQEYLNNLDILEFQKKNLETAELNFRRSKELYVLGQLTTTAFREAQLNLIDARKSIASAGYDAKILELRLKRFAGKLVTEEDAVGSDSR